MSLFARIKNSRHRARPTKFVTPLEAFKAQVEVVPNRDITGWADKDSKAKYHLHQGKVYAVDEDLARQWSIKGYVTVLRGSITPASPDEVAEILSTVTVVNMGKADN